MSLGWRSAWASFRGGGGRAGQGGGRGLGQGGGRAVGGERHLLSALFLPLRQLRPGLRQTLLVASGVQH